MRTLIAAALLFLSPTAFAFDSVRTAASPGLQIPPKRYAPLSPAAKAQANQKKGLEKFNPYSANKTIPAPHR